jgi:hypothetical protein
LNIIYLFGMSDNNYGPTNAPTRTLDEETAYDLDYTVPLWSQVLFGLSATWTIVIGFIFRQNYG